MVTAWIYSFWSVNVCMRDCSLVLYPSTECVCDMHGVSVRSLDVCVSACIIHDLRAFCLLVGVFARMRAPRVADHDSIY